MNSMWTLFRSLYAGDYFHVPGGGEWYVKVQPLFTPDDKRVNAVCLTTGEVRHFKDLDMLVQVENVTFEGEVAMF